VIAVNRLLDDPVRRADLGKAARAWVLSRYTWAKTAERIDAVLRGVLNGAPIASESSPPRDAAAPFPTGLIAC
jgi:Glycosyl transferases group 1